MPTRDYLHSLNNSLDDVANLLAGDDGIVGFNPDIIKHIDEIENTLLQVELTIKDINSIPGPIKEGLNSTLKRVHDSLSIIRLQYTSPLDVDGSIERSGIGALPILELEEFTLYPSSKEVVVNGEASKLPPAEFKVLYSLASRCGQVVNLGSSHSLLTRLSNLRRQIPVLKSRIESLGSGVYQLNCKNKK